MIKHEDVYYIGYIQKFRGLQGEVELLFNDDPFDRGTSPYLVLEIDGIMVPFFLEDYRFKNNDTAILKFADTDTDLDAKKLVGLKVYYPYAHLEGDADEDAELSSLRALTGYTIYEENAGLLGTIDEVYDATENPLFYITNNRGDELVIPYHDDFLVAFDMKKRTICVSLPEGILDLNQ
ncbi:MAG: 16S rRNA processing protein RimM [Bacteroidaceae bacterium]|jgi:16S rRNA processing protein RimM|nr:16S rRNA processing protein RimM [Bacteroidaceae bacterium]